jgi:hypothetical protein
MIPSVLNQWAKSFNAGRRTKEARRFVASLRPDADTPAVVDLGIGLRLKFGVKFARAFCVHSIVAKRSIFDDALDELARERILTSGRVLKRVRRNYLI